MDAGTTWAFSVGVPVLFGVAATLTLSRTLGTSLGISVFGTPFSTQLANGLTQGNAGASRLGLKTLTNPVIRAGLADPVLATARDASASALNAVFLVALPVFVIGLASALLMRNFPLRTNN